MKEESTPEEAEKCEELRGWIKFLLEEQAKSRNKVANPLNSSQSHLKETSPSENLTENPVKSEEESNLDINSQEEKLSAVQSLNSVEDEKENDSNINIEKNEQSKKSKMSFFEPAKSFSHKKAESKQTQGLLRANAK